MPGCCLEIDVVILYEEAIAGIAVVSLLCEVKSSFIVGNAEEFGTDARLQHFCNQLVHSLIIESVVGAFTGNIRVMSG